MSGEGMVELGPVASGRRVAASAGVLALVVVVIGLVTLPQYGITSDEPVAFHGAEWSAWASQSNDPNRWNFKDNPPAEFARQAHFNTHPDPAALRMPSLPALVGVTLAPLAKHLPGYELLDSVHAGLVVLHGLIVFALVLYLARLIGLGRALLAACAYAAYPTVVGHAHYNIKDLPMAGFFALALLSFAVGLIENRARFIVQSGFWIGLSFACKANAVFVAPTVALWIPFAAWLFYRGGRLPSRRLVAAACLLPWIALVTLWAFWPYLRAGNLMEQGRKLGEMLETMARFAATGRQYPTPFPFVALLTMTQPVLLLGLALSLPAFAKKDPRDRAVLALGWIGLLLPLVRIALPRSNFYDGNRLFFEYVPALAILSAMGLAWGWEQLRARTALSKKSWEPAARRASLAAFGGLLLWPNVQYHPYESTYFNLFAGGLGGAQKAEVLTRYCKDMDFYCPDSETDYWAFSFRNAVREMNKEAPQGAGFYPCGNLMGPLTRWQGARPDLRQVGREQAQFFVVIPRRPFCSEDDQRYAREQGTLVREERRDGGLVWALYRRK
ncbi:MAG: hypothetical protein QM765_06150 [Myxococcales bacterium]